VTSKIEKVYEQSELLKTFASHRSEYAMEVVELTNILTDDINEFKHQYDIGEATNTYCQLKSKLFLIKINEAVNAASNSRIRN
jgi:hypothetical protein